MTFIEIDKLVRLHLPGYRIYKADDVERMRDEVLEAYVFKETLAEAIVLLEDINLYRLGLVKEKNYEVSDELRTILSNSYYNKYILYL